MRARKAKLTVKVMPPAVSGGPHRRPSNGGYQRGEETRARVIEAAIETFGRSGYNSSSTREIAALAGVNPPALQYYFNSKLGLYRACVDLVTRRIEKRLQPALHAADKMLRSKASVDDLIEAFCVLQDSLVDSFYAQNEAQSIGRLLNWEEKVVEMQQARQVMKIRVDSPVGRIVMGLVARITGKPPGKLETMLQAFTILGQTMAFHLDQRRLFDALKWTRANARSIKLIKSILRSHATILLRGLAVQNFDSKAKLNNRRSRVSSAG